MITVKTGKNNTPVYFPVLAGETEGFQIIY